VNSGPDQVVDSHSFTLSTGTVTGFLAPNGTGKTTTPPPILGLTNPSPVPRAPAGAAGLALTARRDINQENTCNSMTKHRVAAAAGS
jgi:ABC-type multidrug transport system ATPase subunit